MSTRRELTVQTARKKGVTALVTGLGGLAITAFMFQIGTIIGLIALGVSGFLTWNRVKDWFEFRAKWGLRF